MPRLDKAALTRKGLRRKTLTLPDTDGQVSIRELTSEEVREYRRGFQASTPEPGCYPTQEQEDAQFNLTADLVLRGLVDEQGQQLFTDDDRDAIRNMSVATIAFIARNVASFSGMTDGADAKNAVAAS